MTTIAPHQLASVAGGNQGSVREACKIGSRIGGVIGAGSVGIAEAAGGVRRAVIGTVGGGIVGAGLGCAGFATVEALANLPRVIRTGD